MLPQLLCACVAPSSASWIHGTGALLVFTTLLIPVNRNMKMRISKTRQAAVFKKILRGEETMRPTVRVPLANMQRSDR